MSSKIKIISGKDAPTPAGKLVTNGGRPTRNIFEAEFDPQQERPSMILLDTIAFIRNVDPVTLDPLAEAIDTDALDTLLTAQSDPDTHPIEVTFSYEGFHISIRNTGNIRIRWNE